jgi:hypothetical protein
MRSSLVRAVTAAALATVFALGGSSSAAFANDVVVDFNKCEPFELTPGGILCQNTHAVIQYTQTPSGNFSAVYNAKYKVTYTAPDCNQTLTQQTHEIYLVQGDQEQQHVFRETGESTFDCATLDVRVSCEFTTVANFANGEVRVDRSETICTELP